MLLEDKFYFGANPRDSVKIPKELKDPLKVQASTRGEHVM